jgi:hypothetical protein
MFSIELGQRFASTVSLRAHQPWVWRFYVGLLLLALSIAAWVLFYAPPNMDEFLPYHALACSHYPEASAHIFREGCYAYRTETLWHTLYYRPYGYVGVVSSVLYAPFFRVWPSMVSLYALACVITLLLYFCIARLHRLGWGWALILTAFFPITYQMLHDTGPIRIAMLSFPLIALMARQMMQSHAVLRYALGLCAAFVMACAVEDKPFYLLLTPGLFFYVLAFVEGSMLQCFKRCVGPMLLALVAFSVLIALILLQRVGSQSELYYYQTLSSVGGRHTLMETLNALALFMFDPSAYAHRDFMINQFSINLSIGAMLLLFLIPLLISGLLQRRFDRADLCLLLSFVCTIGIFMVNRAVWAGHHFVYLFLPLLSLFLRQIRPHNACRRMGGLVCLGLFCVGLLSSTQTFAYVSPGGSVLTTYLQHDEVGNHSLINFSSWGLYYIQSLYGAQGQSVTYAEPLTPSIAEMLVAKARSQGRDVLNACLDCDVNSMHASFGAHADSIEEIPINALPWRVFRIHPQQF